MKNQSGFNLCKSHGGGKTERKLMHNFVISKLSRKELEDRFCTAVELNIFLKKEINSKDEKLKLLGTKLLRLTEQQKKETNNSELYHPLERILEEQSSRIELLQKTNTKLNEKVNILKRQVNAQKCLLSSTKSNKPVRFSSAESQRKCPIDFDENVINKNGQGSGTSLSPELNTPTISQSKNDTKMNSNKQYRNVSSCCSTKNISDGSVDSFSNIKNPQSPITSTERNTPKYTYITKDIEIQTSFDTLVAQNHKDTQENKNKIATNDQATYEIEQQLNDVKLTQTAIKKVEDLLKALNSRQLEKEKTSCKSCTGCKNKESSDKQSIVFLRQELQKETLNFQSQKTMNNILLARLTEMQTQLDCFIVQASRQSSVDSERPPKTAYLKTFTKKDSNFGIDAYMKTEKSSKSSFEEREINVVPVLPNNIMSSSPMKTASNQPINKSNTTLSDHLRQQSEDEEMQALKKSSSQSTSKSVVHSQVPVPRQSSKSEVNQIEKNACPISTILSNKSDETQSTKNSMKDEENKLEESSTSRSAGHVAADSKKSTVETIQPDSQPPVVTKTSSKDETHQPVPKNRSMHVEENRSESDDKQQVTHSKSAAVQSNAAENYSKSSPQKLSVVKAIQPDQINGNNSERVKENKSISPPIVPAKRSSINKYVINDSLNMNQHSKVILPITPPVAAARRSLKDPKYENANNRTLVQSLVVQPETDDIILSGQEDNSALVHPIATVRQSNVTSDNSINHSNDKLINTRYAQSTFASKHSFNNEDNHLRHTLNRESLRKYKSEDGSQLPPTNKSIAQPIVTTKPLQDGGHQLTNSSNRQSLVSSNSSKLDEGNRSVHKVSEKSKTYFDRSVDQDSLDKSEVAKRSNEINLNHSKNTLKENFNRSEISFQNQIPEVLSKQSLENVNNTKISSTKLDSHQLVTKKSIEIDDSIVSNYESVHNCVTTSNNALKQQLPFMDHTRNRKKSSVECQTSLSDKAQAEKNALAKDKIPAAYPANGTKDVLQGIEEIDESSSVDDATYSIKSDEQHNSTGGTTPVEYLSDGEVPGSAPQQLKRQSHPCLCLKNSPALRLENIDQISSCRCSLESDDSGEEMGQFRKKKKSVIPLKVKAESTLRAISKEMETCNKLLDCDNSKICQERRASFDENRKSYYMASIKNRSSSMNKDP